MKKILTTLLLSCLFLYPAMAQDYPDSLIVTGDSPYNFREMPPIDYQLPSYTRNELDFSLTLGTGLQTAGVVAGVAASIIGSIVGSLSGSYDSYVAIPIIIPGPSIEYYRWLNDSFAVGAILNADIVSFLPYAFVSNISLMPEVQYRWLCREKVKLYSKLAVGYLGTLFIEQNDEGTYNTHFGSMFGFDGIFSDSASWLAKSYFFPPFGFQVTPIGIDLTTPGKTLGFYMEVGFGTQGPFTFGLKKAF